ncbi:MAG: hypothetical protein HeimC2_39540 [Candidatus Heimdallarchaeota archaeon LC_2]|nr:MAG: hypothetical protein HeimC2_39540 [Candidatus Heimdallarchaeota archaeon LC_2]
MHDFVATLFYNRKGIMIKLNKLNKLIILFLIISVFPLLTNNQINTSAHEIRQIETIEYDASPHFKQSSSKTIPVVIDQDNTIISLGSINYFTTQRVMTGYFNFSNIQLEFDGLEAYQVILHQKIFFQDFYIPNRDPDALGIISHKLSNSALHDGELSFIYNLRNLDDLIWNRDVQSDDTKDFFNGAENRDKFNFTIENSIEFIRGTKQNARFDMFYEISIYISPDIPLDYFHYKQKMNSSVLPNQINVDGSDLFESINKVYLFLPDELIPSYFKSSEEHKLNLTEIPLKINLSFDLSNSNNDYRRIFTIENGGYYGSRTEKSEFSEKYKLLIMLSDNPLIPITISSLAFTGEIKITITLEMTALFVDTRLYAKNEYFFSPNQYLLLISTFSTIFVYTMVAYVGHRTNQNVIAHKNYDLVEEEFMQ